MLNFSKCHVSLSTSQPVKQGCNSFLGDGSLGLDYVVYGNIIRGKKNLTPHKPLFKKKKTFSIAIKGKW